MDSAKSLSFTLWLVATGLFMQTLDTTIVNTALPAMAATLGESPLRMQSVVIAYALTMAVLIPASGWMADRFGTRKVYFSAIVLFTIGSILCAVSQNLDQLVASRVIQGAGGAMLMPVGRLAILRTFPQERLLPALSFVAIPAMIGPMIGPVLGGWLAETLSWHWVFLINIPVGAIGAYATHRYMPDKHDDQRQPFDGVGYGLLAFGMAAISLALDGMSGRGMGHAPAVLLLVFGIIAVVSYWLRAARHPAPLFSPTLFRIHTFTIGLLGNLFARLGSSGMPFLLPLLLQVSLGYSPTHSGMMMLPVAAAGMLSKRLATALITHYGYRRVLVVNTVLVGLTIASFALIDATHPVWAQALLMAFFGAVNSLQFTAMNTLTLKDLGQHGASSGNSILSMMQMLAMSLSVTVAGGILAAFSHLVDHDSASDTLAAFHGTFICIGLLTAASAWIFWQLSPDVERESKKDDSLDLG
ncbi:putative transport protein HsrA [Pigmentiphaga humi]|uniref:Putative transport protein HsrA n=1 Tax=Pigmentiphaga humi TaxID=2478468 RepID=A0A3P4B5D8_9BURK|nr:multidrug transporter subunit MdtD [Pigmentiphaga humi]VCU70746.1 putative transport protein HsrA [Pigmentiphaga humi]